MKVYLSVSYSADRELVQKVTQDLNSLENAVILRYNNPYNSWNMSDTARLKSADIMVVIPPKFQENFDWSCGRYVGKGQHNEITTFNKENSIYLVQQTPEQKKNPNLYYYHRIVCMKTLLPNEDGYNFSTRCGYIPLAASATLLEIQKKVMASRDSNLPQEALDAINEAKAACSTSNTKPSKRFQQESNEDLASALNELAASKIAVSGSVLFKEETTGSASNMRFKKDYAIAACVTVSDDELIPIPLDAEIPMLALYPVICKV